PSTGSAPGPDRNTMPAAATPAPHYQRRAMRATPRNAALSRQARLEHDVPSAATGQDGRPRRRRWPRRVFAATILLAALFVMSADLAYIYLTNRLNQIPRIDVAGLQPAGAGDPQ